MGVQLTHDYKNIAPFIKNINAGDIHVKLREWYNDILQNTQNWLGIYFWLVDLTETRV